MKEEIIKKYIIEKEGTKEIEISFDVKQGEEIVYINNNICRNYVLLNFENKSKIIFSDELKIGDKIFITRKSSLIRQSKFLKNDIIDAEKLNHEIDTIYKILNEFSYEIDATLKFDLKHFDEQYVNNVENKKNKLVGYNNWGKLSLINADSKNSPLTSIDVIKDIGLENYLKANFDNLNIDLLKSYLNMGSICTKNSSEFLRSDFQNFDIEYILNHVKNLPILNKKIITLYEENPDKPPVIKNSYINIKGGFENYSKIKLFFRYYTSPTLRCSWTVNTYPVENNKEYSEYLMVAGASSLVKVMHDKIKGYVLPNNWYIWKVVGVEA